MAGNQLTLARLIADVSTEEQEAAERALIQRISALRPSIEKLDSVENLDSRRRVRRTRSEIPDRGIHVSESLSAYRPKARGQQPYCPARSPKTKPRPYRTPTPSRPCVCGLTHSVPNPKAWQSSPAEEPDWDYNRPAGGHPARASKVTFADSMVTEVKVFERWYADAYGKWGETTDLTTEAEDDENVRMLSQPSTLGTLVSSVSKRFPANCLRSAPPTTPDAVQSTGAAKVDRPKIQSLREVSILKTR